MENEIKTPKDYVGIKNRFVEYVKNNNRFIVHNSVKDFVVSYISEHLNECIDIESVQGLQLINDDDVFQMYKLPYVFQRKGVTACKSILMNFANYLQKRWHRKWKI